MSKKKRLFGILLALPPLLLGLLYGGGYIAQFMRNYHEWEAAGGTPGNGTSPTVPSFAVSECLRAIFTMPYGIVGILICVGALVLLIVMVMRMGYSETGEYDKDRNFIYSKKGTYGTSGFMSEKEAEEIFDLRTSLKNHNGTIFGLLNGRYVCMPEESMLNKNVAVYGASGSMKTRAYCINRILQATVPNKDGKMESLIICDPKSELYEKTSELLRKTHTVKVFNLVCPENSDSWNCLAEIEGDELMAQRFCDVIIKNTGSERGDHFWDSAEMNLLKALAGAVFGVYAVEDTYTLDGTKRYSAGDKVATLTTAADGTAISEPLFLGKFELREEKAPYGMVLLKEPVQTELTYAGEQVKITTVSETAVNERQKVVISLLKKLESDNTYGVGLGEEYKNIRFGLYAAEPLTAADGTEIPQDGLLEIVGIDENGLAVFTADVPAGAKLYVKEVATDAHYLLSDAIYPVAFDYEDVSVAFVQLVINNGEVIENTIIRGSIHGLKVDEDNTPVAGAVFGLFKANETEFTEENALATATPGEDGVFTFENIPYGDWIVRELSCPAHLVLSEESYKVTVSEKDQIIEITVVNKFLTGKVQVRKVSSKDHDKLLSGAEFVLYLDVNGNKAYDPDIDTLYGELSEADTGVYELSGLKHGGYLLLETKAPDGFTKDDRYFYFPIQKDGETVIVENEIGVGFTNEPIPTPTPKYPDSPQTGDNSKLWLWILLASGSLTVLITVSIVSRKKRKAL